jgi:NADH:ubiquinone oxidoreductase subunit 4 (subunit M)
MLTLYMKTMYGELDETKNGDLTDVSRRELITFAPLFVMVFWMGLFPQRFLATIEPTMNGYMKMVQERGEARRAFDAARNGVDTPEVAQTSPQASASLQTRNNDS